MANSGYDNRLWCTMVWGLNVEGWRLEDHPTLKPVIETCQVGIVGQLSLCAWPPCYLVTTSFENALEAAKMLHYAPRPDSTKDYVFAGVHGTVDWVLQGRDALVDFDVANPRRHMTRFFNREYYEVLLRLGKEDQEAPSPQSRPGAKRPRTGEDDSTLRPTPATPAFHNPSPFLAGGTSTPSGSTGASAYSPSGGSGSGSTGGFGSSGGSGSTGGSGSKGDSTARRPPASYESSKIPHDQFIANLGVSYYLAPRKDTFHPSDAPVPVLRNSVARDREDYIKLAWRLRNLRGDTLELTLSDAGVNAIAKMVADKTGYKPWRAQVHPGWDSIGYDLDLEFASFEALKTVRTCKNLGADVIKDWGAAKRMQDKEELAQTRALALTTVQHNTAEAIRYLEAMNSHQRPSPFAVAEVFTGIEGRLVPLKKTVESFKAILAGEYDHLPENAFYMVGDIEDVQKKAQQLAAELEAGNN